MLHTITNFFLAVPLNLIINIIILCYSQTPDGVVSLKHWYAILTIENSHSFNLKSSYRLDENHIKPKYYQKMNVAMAFRVRCNFVYV